LCQAPIGVAEDDPRWAQHDPECEDCELCRDRVPAELFNGAGKATTSARFHTNCFAKLLLSTG
jgi:hypothetical protein